MAQLRGPGLLRQIRQVVAAQCPSRQSDAQLVQQFVAERDEVAFAALVGRHGPLVLGVCQSVLNHRQDAEDVFQAAFLVLARKPHTIRKQQALGSWLHGVAYRLALKARARRTRRPERPMPTPDARPAGTQDDLTVRELRVIMHEELQRLAEKYRAPLLLCYFDGKTRDEAADQLGMTPGAFKKRLDRARRLLGCRLARRGLVPSLVSSASLFSETGAQAGLSTSLIQTTAQAATAFAVGTSATAWASASALALAEGAIRTMNITRWATTVLMTILLSSLATSASLVGYQALAGRLPDAPVAAAGAEGPAQDQEKPKEAAQKTDRNRLVGTWRVAKGLTDGKELPIEFVVLARLTFTKDGKITMSLVDSVSEGEYKWVGPGKIDIGLHPGEEPAPGIYKFDGDDRFTFCVRQDAADKKGRPTEFTGDKDSGQVLFTLTRAKPGEEKPTKEEIAKFADPAAKIREAVARTLSANNLKQIGLAMHNYHDANGALPLHAIYSKDGKTPLLSWRVAILPYLEQEALYKEFKLDEPWDSTHNKKLIPMMPKLYEISIGKKGEGLTHYQVFTGPDTVFNGAKKTKLQDIANGTSNTILAVEAKDAVIWSKPADLTMPKEKNKLPAFGEHYKNGFQILMCDGSVRMLPHNPDPKVVRSSVNPKGGD